MAKPNVILKLATSMDGKIALSNGESQWITSAESRARVHQMRLGADAILVGAGTVRADDPLLTARTVPVPTSQPARIVADSNAAISVHSRLVQSVGLGRVIVASAQPPGPAVQALEAAGAEIWRCGDTLGRVSPQRLLDFCSTEGFNNIFLEGGGQLAASFLRLNLVDRIEWFRAPILIGGDGLPAIGPLDISQMSDVSKWQLTNIERIGSDLLETYKRAS